MIRVIRPIRRGVPMRLRLVGAALVCAVALAPLSAAAQSVEAELSFHRGVVAFGQDDLEEARRQFERVVEIDPQDEAALHYLALIAQEQGRLEEAIELYQRARELDPDDSDLLFDLGTALLDAGRNAEARTAFEQVIQRQPQRARAHLFAGIAAYRDRQYDAAIGSLDRAVELQPDLRVQARYYQGLAEAFRGDLIAAEGAFSDVQEQSPQSPLGRSAGSLAGRVREATPRNWTLSVTGGWEWDTNPTLGGEGAEQDDQFRLIGRVRGSYRIFDFERLDLTAGYDGYVGWHFENNDVDLQTHTGWASLGSTWGPVRLGLRYDYLFSLLDLTRELRMLHVVTPSATVREGGWGLTQAYFQYQNHDQRIDIASPAFDRDGHQYTVAINQFIFVGGPLRYVRFGALGDFYRPDGSEFDYHGVEGNVGFGLTLPFGFELTALYRFGYRDYLNKSVVVAKFRDDMRHRLDLDLAKEIAEGWELSGAGNFTDNKSDVGPFDYDRLILGVYVTHRF